MFLPNLVTILTINVQIVGNDEYLILDIEVGWQGANQDARIWENSNVNRVTAPVPGSRGLWISHQ
jgi:hypothetical protein